MQDNSNPGEESLPYGFESGLVQLLNEARCHSKRTVGNRELAARIVEYIKRTSQPQRHQWDDAGERCVKCGDKDWMQSTCAGGKPDE